ncbi:MFS transporter [Peribacillus cavernae]|uniref:MFS transporter n=1 Tax=Peribacillus cavernae TaxID=1674310 RepID=A0A3S0VHU5_9BACI|nr:MFS transporter [Peribacillus cavernae]MDQ0217809.1 PPP family 3-phenylpropionic acid transporter [Peribacillus cavernae]RUQ28260.1 MFS transporter [Peribacillus cavernae]
MDKHIKINLFKLQGFYLFSFFAMGSLTPLLSVYLSEVEKLNGYQIGTIMSAGPVIMIVFQPLWGMVCDWTRKPAKILSVTTLMAGIVALGYLFLHQYYMLVGIAVLLAVFQSAIIPVSDSISLQYASKVKANYGNIRLFGSLGFGIAVFVMGQLSETRIGPGVIFYAFFIGLAAAAVLALCLPQESRSVRSRITHGIKNLFTIKRFLIFLAVTFLIFGPNLANNVYFGLFVEARGGTYTGIGIAFLLAVLSEIPFMRVAESWIRKLGLLQITLIASIASLVRWILYFTEPGLGIVYATSVIQGFSLGLFIPAGLQYIRHIVPAQITVTAVTVYSAIGNGLGNWFSTFMGGIIMEQRNIYSVYLFFAALSSIGVILTIWLIKMERARSFP